MIVNEAPRLTTRAVVLLMLVMFLLCLAGDQFQCSKNGRQSFCSGAPPYRCTNSYCQERVELPSENYRESRCLFKGTSDVLFAFVEMGPSLVSPRGRSVSEYMAEELTSLIETNTFPRSMPDDTSQTSGYYRRVRMRVVDEYHMLSDSLERLKKHKPNNTRYTVLSETFPLPLYVPGKPTSYSFWRDAVEAVLPTSKLDNPRQLKTYFPNLYRALDAAVARRKKSTVDPHCDALHLVVYISLSPLTSVRAVWDLPDVALDSLKEGYEWTSGAISRYISTNKRILKYLDGVSYVYLYVPPPARTFARTPFEVDSSPVMQLPRSERPTAPTSAENAMGAAMPNETAAVAFCNASGDAVNVTRCLDGCQGYFALSSTALQVEGSVCRAQNPSDRVFQTYRAISPEYINCYFHVLGNGTSTPVNGSFGAEVEARSFDDCLHLSPAGGKAFASCQLKTRGVGERSYW